MNLSVSVGNVSSAKHLINRNLFLSSSKNIYRTPNCTADTNLRGASRFYNKVTGLQKHLDPAGLQ